MIEDNNNIEVLIFTDQSGKDHRINFKNTSDTYWFRLMDICNVCNITVSPSRFSSDQRLTSKLNLKGETEKYTIINEDEMRALITEFNKKSTAFFGIWEQIVDYDNK